MLLEHIAKEWDLSIFLKRNTDILVLERVQKCSDLILCLNILSYKVSF